MSTTAEIRPVLADVIGLTNQVLTKAAAMEALLAKGEAGRSERSESKPIEVMEVRQVEGRILGKVQGVESVYHPRITVTPKRSFRCDCPDAQRQGRKVGPCKHTLALARHVLDSMQPELGLLHQNLVNVLF
jgi:hypothetical protein